MAITFDPAKSERNRERRGLAFKMVEDLEWSSAIYGVSRAQNFDTSTRFFAVGSIEGAVYTVAFHIRG